MNELDFYNLEYVPDSFYKPFDSKSKNRNGSKVLDNLFIISVIEDSGCFHSNDLKSLVSDKYISIYN